MPDLNIQLPSNLIEEIENVGQTEIAKKLIAIIGILAAFLGLNAILPNMPVIDDLISRFTRSSGIERFDELADRLEFILKTGVLPAEVSEQLKVIVDYVQAGTGLWDMFKGFKP